jgi:hypothetical protein
MLANRALQPTSGAKGLGGSKCSCGPLAAERQDVGPTPNFATEINCRRLP